MSPYFVDDLPGLEDPNCRLSLRTHGSEAFLASSKFLCALSLEAGVVKWLVQRQRPVLSESTRQLPRLINLWGSDLWIGQNNGRLAEITPTDRGGVTLSVRDVETGAQHWEKSIDVPDAADWAEPAPAWPGARTEEIHAFVADDAECLVLCLCRHTRRSGLSDPARGIHVFSLPEFRCQTDAVRFDPKTGAQSWRATFHDVHVGIIERNGFEGIWSNGRQLGAIDFEAGTNKVLFDSQKRLGWPVREGSVLVVSWHDKDEAGILWIDQNGSRTKQSFWRASGVKSTALHATEAGLAMQINDQTLLWLGANETPAWSSRVKPYIYRVHAGPATDVFVGTDGNGGRLFGFDAGSGRQTMNLKPALGGVGTLTKIQAHKVLVADYRVSRSYSRPSRLLLLNMTDHTYDLSHECRGFVGAWEHGVICRAGKNGERLAVFDIRALRGRQQRNDVVPAE